MRALATILICSLPAAAQSSPPAKTRKTPAVAYRSECLNSAGFCIRVPAAWQRLGDIFGDLGFVVAEPHAGADSASRPQLTVAAIDLAPKEGGGTAAPVREPAIPSLDVLVERMLTPEGALASARTLERRRLLLNGASAQIVRVELRDEEGKPDAIEEIALIEGADGMVYSIALRCAQQDFTTENHSPGRQESAPEAAHSPQPRQDSQPNKAMKIIRDIAEMQAASRAARMGGLSIGFVPTMGALHEGHLSLARRARAQATLVVVSIFVNPLQFGPSEDFGRYPRTLESDCALLEAEGVEVVFAPSTEQMYPPDATTVVYVEGVSDRLDGRSRPGHFRGVSTVVAKLFHIVGPDCAVFGQKDAAQVAVLRRMVRDLNMPIELIVAPIARDPDGLALSSRNAYLSADERRQALVLHRALQRVEELAGSGETNSERLRSAALYVLADEPAAVLDYLEIVNPDTLLPVDSVARGALFAVAASFGPTRLIDNVLLPPR